MPQSAWAMGARALGAVLQIGILGVLAHELSVQRFAVVATADAISRAVISLNGFGILRQIELRRSLEPQSSILSVLFHKRLSYSLGSGAVWLVVALGGFLVTRDVFFLAMLPMAVWLVGEQTTQIWNTIATVDGNAREVFWSIAIRRTVPLALVAATLVTHSHVVWSWTLGMSLGSVAAILVADRRQEPWARIRLWWRRPRARQAINLDFGFWFSSVSEQLKQLDVAVVTAVSPLVGGIFALPSRLVSPINLLTQGASAVAFPTVARRNALTRRQLQLGLAACTAPSVLLALLVAAAAPLTPTILGEDYAPAVAPIQVVCFAAIFRGASQILLTFIQARDTPDDTLRAGRTSLAFGVAHLVLAAIGALVAGALGAACGVVVSEVLFCAALWRFALRAFGHGRSAEGLATAESRSSG